MTPWTLLSILNYFMKYENLPWQVNHMYLLVGVSLHTAYVYINKRFCTQEHNNKHGKLKVDNVKKMVTKCQKSFIISTTDHWHYPTSAGRRRVSDESRNLIKTRKSITSQSLTNQFNVILSFFCDNVWMEFNFTWVELHMGLPRWGCLHYFDVIDKNHRKKNNRNE